MLTNRSIYGEYHEMFRESVRNFLRAELEPNIAEWEKIGKTPRSFWKQAGEQGFLCPAIPEEYGGPGADFLFNMIVDEEIGYAVGGGSVGFAAHSDMCAHYILNRGTEEQKRAYLPAMATGEKIAAIAMTEPGAGSDLKAIKTTADLDGDHYVLNGQKTYITNGQNADFFVLACRTDKEGGAKGISLLLVDASLEGFSRGTNLDKIGQKAADTSELFFDNVRVPSDRLLGGEGQGFAIMMEELARERLSVAVRALAAATRAYDLAREYVTERQAFGKQIWDFQNTKFVLADVKTKLHVSWAYIDQCLTKVADDRLGLDDGAMAKLWCSELEGEVVDACLQLFGGYGYMAEYPISRFYTDARVRRIYGGTTEIMKSYISRFVHS